MEEGAGSRTRRAFRSRRRNRHGRGLRSPLLPPELPGALTRSGIFDQHVAESAERLEQLWGSAIDAIEFQVEDIPPNLEQLAALGGRAPLGSFRPAAGTHAAVIVVYRHPVQTAARHHAGIGELVHCTVVEQAAELLGMSPEAVDPIYGRFGG